jgi:multiple sugar transport system ATP-binding protein
MTLGDRVAVMRDGTIQQLDTPQAVYDRPANLFVASFIGSPGMNLLDGTVGEGGIETRLGVIPFAAGDLSRGQSVVVGIRPEDFTLDRATAGPSPWTLSPTVELIESLGSDLLAYFGGTLVARLAPRSQAQPAAPVTLHVDTTRLHIFAPDPDGRRLI